MLNHREQETTLFTLIKKRKDKQVAEMLSDPMFDKAKIDTLKDDGCPLVHVVVQHNLPQALKALLKKGANPNLIDSQGRTPLHRAAILNHSLMAVALLAHPELRLEMRDNLGRTALHLAVMHYAGKKPKKSVLHVLLHPADAQDVYKKVDKKGVSAMKSYRSSPKLIQECDNAGFAAIHYAALIAEHPLPNNEALYKLLSPETLDARGERLFDMKGKTPGVAKARIADKGKDRRALWAAYYAAQASDEGDTLEAARALMEAFFEGTSDEQNRVYGMFHSLRNKHPELAAEDDAKVNQVKDIIARPLNPESQYLQSADRLMSRYVSSRSFYPGHEYLIKRNDLNLRQTLEYAEICYGLGLLDKAKRAYEHCLTSEVGFDEASKAMIRTNLAHIAYKHGNYEAVISDCELVLQQADIPLIQVQRCEALLNNATLLAASPKPAAHSDIPPGELLEKQYGLDDNVMDFIERIQHQFLSQWHAFKEDKKIKDKGAYGRVALAKSIATVGHLLPSTVELTTEKAGASYTNDPGKMLSEYTDALSNYYVGKKKEAADAWNRRKNKVIELHDFIDESHEAMAVAVGLAALRFYQLFKHQLETEGYLTKRSFSNALVHRIINYIFQKNDFTRAKHSLFMRGLFHGARHREKADKKRKKLDEKVDNFIRKVNIQLRDSGIGLAFKPKRIVVDRTIQLTFKEFRDYRLRGWYQQVSQLSLDRASIDFATLSRSITKKVKETPFETSIDDGLLEVSWEHEARFSYSLIEEARALEDAKSMDSRVITLDDEALEEVEASERTREVDVVAGTETTSPSPIDTTLWKLVAGLPLERQEKVIDKLMKVQERLALAEGKSLCMTDEAQVIYADTMEEEIIEGLTFEQARQWRQDKAEERRKKEEKAKASGVGTMLAHVKISAENAALFDKAKLKAAKDYFSARMKLREAPTPRSAGTPTATSTSLPEPTPTEPSDIERTTKAWKEDWYDDVSEDEAESVELIPEEVRLSRELWSRRTSLDEPDKTIVLGRGQGSMVYEGRVFANGQIKPAAIKSFTPSDESEFNKAFSQQANTVAKVKKIGSSGLIGLFGMTRHQNKKTEQRRFSLVMEKGEMTLKDYLDELHAEGRTLSLQEKYTLAFQIASGLADLHEANIVHSDIKDTNVLLTSTDPLHVKLCDFDISRVRSRFTASTKRTIMAGEATVIGTRAWMAPELIVGKGLEHTRETDMFSLALILWRIAHDGKPLFGEDEDCIPDDEVERIQLYTTEFDFRPTIDDVCDAKLKELIHQCWQATYEKKGRGRQIKVSPNGKQRCTASDVLETLTSLIEEFDEPEEGEESSETSRESSEGKKSSTTPRGR